MKGFILAAGLGTRLKPWTLEHPKALVPVAGVPMLERVICRLKENGFDDITVNVHHFSNQIVDFLSEHDFGVNITISDESEDLLDTGGGLLKVAPDAPMLIHNVDILSDAPLREIMNDHIESGRDITLVTSGRESSRKLLFDTDGKLSGWHNLKSGEYRPAGIEVDPVWSDEAFSGIYVVSPSVVPALRRYSERIGSEKFPIMDFLLSMPEGLNIGRKHLDNLRLIDIGKPETLATAQEKLLR